MDDDSVEPALGPARDTEEREGNRYRLLEVIGRGGFAVVYSALDEITGRTVAVKAATGGDLDGRRLLQVEAEILARLHHPAVPALIDSQLDADPPFIVVELRGDRNLADDLALGPIGARRMVEVVGPVVDCLEQAHAMGIVHRDVTPANILVDARGRGSLTDFGNATDRGRASSTVDDGRVALTPRWAAPEVRRGDAATLASDVYATGLVIAACLGAARSTVVDGATTTTVEVSALDSRWRRVITAAMDDDPARRPPVADLHPRRVIAESQHTARDWTEFDAGRTEFRPDRTAVLPPPGGGGSTSGASGPAVVPSMIRQVEERSRRRRIIGAVALVVTLGAGAVIVASAVGGTSPGPSNTPAPTTPAPFDTVSPTTTPAAAATSTLPPTSGPTVAAAPTITGKGNGNGKGKGKDKGKGG